MFVSSCLLAFLLVFCVWASLVEFEFVFGVLGGCVHVVVCLVIMDCRTRSPDVHEPTGTNWEGKTRLRQQYTNASSNKLLTTPNARANTNVISSLTGPPTGGINVFLTQILDAKNRTARFYLKSLQISFGLATVF